MAFSSKYPTYKEWRMAQTNLSNYVKQIDRLHAKYPNASLNQLRRHPTKNQAPLAALKKQAGGMPSVESLTKHQLDRYERMIEAVRYMRRDGLSLKETSKLLNLSPATIKKMAGDALEFDGSRYKAKATDRLERIMMFYDERGPTTIRIKSSKAASLIGQYHAAIKKYTETGDDSNLLKFKGKAILDATGKKYEFNTNKKQLNEFIRSGDVRFESIYQFTR